MLRYFNLWLGLGWLIAIVMCYISLTPSPPNLNINVAHLDKIEHLSAYFLLMFWFSQLYELRKTRLFYAVIFIAMGIALEILQGIGGVRYFEYYDMLANSLGVAAAWWLTNGRATFLFALIENKFLK